MSLSAELLDWYDNHARSLPWRVSPSERAVGVVPDPYHVWLSEIMLQQTTVAAVKAYFERFTTLWPRVEDLAAADDADVMAEWAGLGYYARARNLLKTARTVAEAGEFPTDEAGLLKLPGVGPYTAAAIASIAYDQPAVVMDGNVERVMARLHNEPTPLPEAKPILKAHAAALTPAQRPGDYAQAVMDLGATICSPKSPACGICPWRTPCAARAAGTAAELPKKTPKAAKPTRHGSAYVARKGDTVLLQTRPEKGLLGGTLAFPTGGWDGTEDTPPFDADWLDAGEVRHTFTHFHLILKVKTVEVPDQVRDAEAFVPAPRATDLPSLMRKVFLLVNKGT